MKQRFNALDIRATVVNLKERLTGLRLQNVYDVNSKTFLFKFGKPDDKELVLIESGTRIHTTQFSREKSAMPSMFCAKLRKHIRTRRLTAVRQVGVDRIVDFEFGGGENSLGFHIIAEFYASGNIILTDHEYRILTLLRVVQNSETARMAPGEIYNIDATLHDFQKVDADKLKHVLQKAGPKDTLKKLLNIGFEYGPAMTEHIILEAGLNPNTKVATEFDCSDESPALQDLLAAFSKGDEMVASTANKVPNGYIILLDNAGGDSRRTLDGEEQKDVDIYDEFHPYLYHQHASKKYLEYPTFDGAVDEFYSAIEAQKLEMKARNQENAAVKKLDAVRKEQQGRVAGLLDQQMTNTRKAQLIEYNLDLVDAAISIIRNAVASQMDWLDLKELVTEEKRKNNPIALMIDGLKLDTNQITLLLSEPNESTDDDSDSDDDSGSDDDSDESSTNSKQQVFKVDVDIATTAFANARNYYDMKKSTAVKHEKTIAATSKALKSAERKIRQDLKETKISVSINKIRKPFWFEKFMWFISTEGHLVIAGRDMQQNEILVKKYLLKGDVYVHADLHGAASVVVKNKPDSVDKPIPPSTLFQAGIMSVCQSKAWDAKIVTSAYWVHPDQVSKSAPTGEYLSTGSFMIRGKKNFLPPVQLVYGFGYLFKLDESSIGNHVSEKRQELVNVDGDDDTQSNTATSNGGEVALDDINDKQKVDTTSKSDGEHVQDEKESPTESVDDSSDDDSSDDENAFPDTQLASNITKPETATDSVDQQTGKEWNKYDLEDYGEDANALPDFAEKQAADKPRIKKTMISAKERRDMKKGNKATPGSGSNTPPLANSTTTPQQKPAKKPTNNKPTEPKQQQPTSTRGRKGKSKKIKEKYGEQDEEERQLRMEILGSNKGPQPKGKKAKKQAQEKAEKLALEKEREERRKQKEAESSVVDTGDKSLSENVPGVNDKTKINETEDIRQLLKEENITMLDGEELASLTSLDSLTANPLPDDILHFAIPVCAPYPALQKYKYKVKLTPGTLKRGKAIKQAQSVFLNHQETTAREKELIKGVPDMEAINTMMSKVKVSAPNLEASKKKKGGRR